MRTMIEKILRAYGKSLVLRHKGKDLTVKAFFQPVTGKLEQYAKLRPGITGMEDFARYVYIGPVDPEAMAGDEITVDKKHYLLRQAQIVYDGEDAVYVWGMCVEKGGTPKWEMNGCSSLQMR